MNHDRRRPLGGIEKATYVESGGHPLTYDLIAGLRGEVCAALLSIKENTAKLKVIGDTNCFKCKNELADQYIKKAFGKWPVSVVELFVYILLIGILIGSSILDPKGLLKHIIKF